MKITGKTTLFVKLNEWEGKKFKTFSTSISHKNEDGSYLNANVEVQFTKAFLTAEKEAYLKEGTAYQLDITDGWLDVRSFTTKDGQLARVLVIKVNEATMLDEKKVKASDTKKGW